jgi:hypothetical protein
MAALSSAKRVHTESLEMGVQELCHATGCGYGDLLVQVVVVAWLVALALLTFAAFSYVRDARGAVADEDRRTRAEAEALERFRRRVSKLDATAPTGAIEGGTTTGTGAAGGGTGPPPGGTGAGVGVGVAAVQTSRPPDDGIRDVKEIYRETVMAVPHYEEDYGESLRTNLAAEFGEELGHAIESGDRFTPQLKQALIAEADEARDRRRQLLRALDDERSTLDDYEATLEELDDRASSAIDRPLYRRTFTELYDAWHDLEALEAECDDLVARRQAELDEGRPAPTLHRDREAFHRYLYGDLDVDYPVLAAGTTVLGRLRDTKRTVLSALTRRV